MDWAKFERMAELYGGGTSPKKAKPNTAKHKGVSKAFRNNHEAVQGFQKELKKRPTFAEKRFKKILYEFFGFKINGGSRKANKAARQFIKFQKVFMLNTLDGKGKGYIIDFFLPKFNLAIEIDGDSHDNKQEYDCKRDRALYNKKHVRTLRISNLVTKNKPQCFALLRSAVKNRPAAPKPRRSAKITINRDVELQLQTEWLKSNEAII